METIWSTAILLTVSNTLTSAFLLTNTETFSKSTLLSFYKVATWRIWLWQFAYASMSSQHTEQSVHHPRLALLSLPRRTLPRRAPFQVRDGHVEVAAPWRMLGCSERRHPPRWSLGRKRMIYCLEPESEFMNESKNLRNKIPREECLTAPVLR